MWGKMWVWWIPLHNLQGNLTLPFFPGTWLSLVDGSTISWWECSNHTSKTFGISRQLIRKWSPLQSLQGYLGLRCMLEVSSTLPTLTTMVGWLNSFLSCFFFFFPILFFLATWLLASRLLPSEEEEMEEEILGEEGKRSTEGWWCWDGELCWGEASSWGGTIWVFEANEVENNYTGKPMVNPGNDNVSI